MTQKDLFQTVTSSRRDTHANHSPSRESKKAQKMTATSGRTSLELLHTKDRLGAFSKTFMVTSPWVSTRCLLTWKPKATPAGRLLFQLVVSMPTTKETDFGLWLTPNTMDHLPIRSEEALKKQYQKNRQGRTTHATLREQVAYPPPEKMWPTPAACDYKGAPRNRYMGSPTYRGNLDEAVRTSKDDGQLNPAWVEWLMGYPEGWTELKD